MLLGGGRWRSSLGRRLRAQRHTLLRVLLLLQLYYLLLEPHDGLVLLLFALLEQAQLGEVVLGGLCRPGGSVVLAPIEDIHEESGKLLGDVLSELVPLMLVDFKGLVHLRKDVLVRFNALSEQTDFVIFHLLELRVHLSLVSRAGLGGVCAGPVAKFQGELPLL